MEFHLELTGYVGGSTFNSSDVRKKLSEYKEKHIDVMINSFGGSLSEGLAICGAFRDHGDVTVHFRGLNASAATLASMGAKRIEMTPESMYLIHKVSMGFFDWASRNSDQLDDFIKALQSTKEDLDTMDKSIAELYASRCKKTAKEMLELMKAEKWISSSDAKNWGFVDAITDTGKGTNGKNELTMSKAEASMFKNLGLPLPPVAIEPESTSLIGEIFEAAKNFFMQFKPQTPITMNTNEVKQPQPSAAVDTAETTINDSPASSSTEATTEKDEDLKAEVERLRTENAALKAKIPGASTVNVVTQPTNPKKESTPEDSAFTRFMKVNNEAKKLYDSIP